MISVCGGFRRLGHLSALKCVECGQDVRRCPKMFLGGADRSRSVRAARLAGHPRRPLPPGTNDVRARGLVISHGCEITASFPRASDLRGSPAVRSRLAGMAELDARQSIPRDRGRLIAGHAAAHRPSLDTWFRLKAKLL